jgi:Zn-dependent protease with chaperone function
MTNTTHLNEQQAYDWLNELAVPEQLSKDDYMYPADKTMLTAFKMIPGAGWMAKKFINILVNFEMSDLLGNSVQVTERQFPELHSLVLKISRILGITPPQTYLFESPEVNAYTIGPSEKNACIIIYRGLIQTCRPRELAYVIGHEMGHIKSEHVLYHTLANFLADKGPIVLSKIPVVGNFAGVLTSPAQLALFAWSRRSEITADRSGLIACQDFISAQRALVLTALGSRELAEKINIEELEKQGTKNFGRWSELLLEHPYMPKRLKALRMFGISHFYLRNIKFDNQTLFLSTDDVNYYVGKILDDKDISDIGYRTRGGSVV